MAIYLLKSLSVLPNALDFNQVRQAAGVPAIGGLGGGKLGLHLDERRLILFKVNVVMILWHTGVFIAFEM